VKAVAILVAAGSGERLGADRPKAFVVLAGRALYQWSLEALGGFEQIVVAVPRETVGAVCDEVAECVPADRVVVVPGGSTRSASVRAALAAAAPSDAVVVHDAARPLVTRALFERCLAGLAGGADGAIAAAPVTDTIKQAGDDGWVQRTLDRSQLWAIQTPQAFRRRALELALDVTEDVLAAATDDAWLVERAGGRVRIVEAPAENLKITTPHDLRVAEALLRERGA
jgi:2-C-methyl-D-erythritol 4-phosphate cytidylyltransferase